MPNRPYKPLPPKFKQAQVEEEVLARWRDLNVFERSLELRAGGKPWVFYEGPPTANGIPGTHHVLARVFKDVFPRFQTMRGRRVERKGGWDCHGLPVELAVEAELGFTSKDDIEKFGIAEFNQRCRDSVFRHVEEWNRLTERIGFWIDLDDAYRTLDASYVESVWWALKTISGKGLLYEGHKVVPYCPRCGTTLSSHELGQPGAYRDVVDTAAFVRLPLAVPHGPLEVEDELVVWTTTPWTLVSNAAVAIDPTLTYARVRVPGSEAALVVAEALVDKALGEDAQILATFPGADLVGAAYRPPFDFITGGEYGPAGHTVLAADFVTADEGTGLVHTAIAFGEDDFRLGERVGLAAINPVLPDGTYDERIGKYAGRQVKDCDEDLLAELEARGRLLRAEPYEHSYPHCWRCSTPLLYYAKPSWYIATSKVRDRMLEENAGIDWHPEHVKDGRFGKWLENNVDWALSRERYWGTPLPVWKCAKGHIHVIGSFDELEELSGVRLEDPHRPYVDDVGFPCIECGDRMQRVPEVIDVWFDSGAMPFAQHHAPLENADHFEERFPADFICEALDQTRGWFYSLLAVSTLLFDKASYKSVVCLGLILDGDGQKMSKSKGNVVEPWSILDQQGADALRWYFLTSKQPWDGYRFSTDAVDESTRRLLLPLWNILGFHVLYANAAGVGPVDGVPEPTNDLDRWILSRLSGTVETVSERLEAFDATTAGREIQDLVEDISNWYVRRSRRRFWDGDEEALAVLRHVLLVTARLLAPFCPFIADVIHTTLDPKGDPSVHLTDWPESGPRDEQLELAMAAAREAVTLGLAARGQAKVKVRQPLRAAVIVATDEEREAIQSLEDIVREELNVKTLEFASAADELAELEVKANYRTLGPKFGPQMPQAAAAVAALDPDHVGQSLKAGSPIHINVGGTEHALEAEDLLIVMRPIEGYQLEHEGSHAVALDLNLDDDLLLEGLAREVVHAVQGARKSAGLEVEDRISLGLGGDERVLAAINAHSEWICSEVLATAFETGIADGENLTIDGHELTVTVTKA
ncbi:MAG: isoleucine--tRNA ligase [Actinobacteria bacterium]|uniref:isoleucine--tRNA ligase n=1 Tax=freshwater metagenome TaxID=449393 RepID=A0A6J7EGG6_9ZZZZ|nr:isoleucine--tRNA ligase [Actinomycetota bacterium]